ncbi:protein kinase [Actinomadura sp. SCN-SB]|uniref:protein kinase domain-containing protein n=1 Tax=Actinomadura sp. SCN-SB TaxID=3373092 RepID=UPI0037519534
MSPGLVLDDRYRLVERLAIGGMGEVWRAADDALGRDVAVKLLRRDLMSDEVARRRFRSEALFAASLRHPGIAQVYDAGVGHGRAYLVMELVAGEPLAEIIDREGALPADAVLDLVEQSARALRAAHDAGIVHRDVKPANLMVTGEGAVKVTDFGIARRVAGASQTQTGMVMGTAYYLSPEQASGRDVTTASDLYSLGVVAYECLTGRVPFDADTAFAVALMHVRDLPPELPGRIPGPVRDLVRDLLAKDPAWRPADAGETADRASAIRGSGGVIGPGLRRWARRPGHGGTDRRPAGPAATRPAVAPPAAGRSPGGGPARRGPARPHGLDDPWPVRAGRPGVGRGVPSTTAVPSATAGVSAYRPGGWGRAGRDTGDLYGFDEDREADSLTSAETTGRRRAALTYASVAAGALLLGVVVVGTMWRGLGDTEPDRENRERLPAVQPGEGDPVRRSPAGPATRSHERRGREAPPVPDRPIRPTTPRRLRASPSHKPTSKPPRATPSAPDPTPAAPGGSTTPAPPSPGPAPSQSGPAFSEGGTLGSGDKV